MSLFKDFATIGVVAEMVSHGNKITWQVGSKYGELIKVENGYDAFGQLERKFVGDFNGDYLQKVDFFYNVRGWMTGINSLDPLEDPDDLFAFKINYETVDDGLDGEVKALYNGNISETFWKSKSDGVLRKYGYKYDSLNRLEHAYFQRPDDAITNVPFYDESMTYDLNGNILSLRRNGNHEIGNTAFEIDRLVYGYGSYSNRLNSVTDESVDPAGFIDGNANGNDYIYDSYGNLVTDRNKGINSISYNHLNLPLRIGYDSPLSYIAYTYNALGQKVHKNVSRHNLLTGNQEQTNTSYQDGFQYENGMLQFFPHSEGYVKVIYKPGGYRYEHVYQYKDHLGNIRMNYGLDPDSGELAILNEDHYYPFGLKHENYNGDVRGFAFEGEPLALKIIQVPSGGEVYKYKYQGQERQDELGLNWDSFKWRNYDYAIGRFMCIDPLAEKYPYNSTYAFSENRVIDGRELEGLEWESIKNDDGTSTRQLTVQMVNNSSLSDKQVSKTITAMQADFAKDFSSPGVTAQLVVQQISSSDGSCEFLVPLVDAKSNTLYDSSGAVIGTTYAGGQTGQLGQTQQNTFEVTATVDGKARSISEVTRSFNHEAGHTAGLEHPWSPTNTVGDIKQGATGVKNSTVRSNLMNSDQNTNVGNRSTSGRSLTSGQFQSMDDLIKSQTTTP